MITNLPKVFDTKKITQFTFGDADAKRDDVINNTAYITSINSLEAIITGKYNIIVGERGTGKSAIFRMFQENKLSFSKKEGYTEHKIFIEADFDLSAFKDFVLRHIKEKRSDSETKLYKYQLSWELFLSFRLLYIIKNDLGIQNTDVNKALDLYKTAFGDIKTNNIFEFLKSLRFTIGAKTSTTNPTIIDAYTKVEPVEPTVSREQRFDQVEFNLFEVKRLINSVLSENKIILRVFIDKLDDFVVKEDYDTQRYILQALLSVEDTYFNTLYLKLYIFLRKDLYERLDLNALGPDKVSSRKIDLVWTKKEIWDFIARRVFYNLKNTFGIDHLEFSIDSKMFTIEEKKLPGLFEKEKENSLVKYLKKVCPNFIKRKFSNGYNHISARRIDFTEEINKEVIYSIFPEKVIHKMQNGTEEDIDFLDYIYTHTALASGSTNPRMIILFLNRLFYNLGIYYKNNPEIKVELNRQGQYKLIPVDIVMNSYNEFKKDLNEIFKKLDSQWNDWFIKFQSIKGVRQVFKYKELIDLLGIKSSKEEEFRRFLAFFSHSGFLSCSDIYKDYQLRKYTIPIVFRDCVKV